MCVEGVLQMRRCLYGDGFGWLRQIGDDEAGGRTRRGVGIWGWGRGLIIGSGSNG